MGRRRRMLGLPRLFALVCPGDQSVLALLGALAGACVSLAEMQLSLWTHAQSTQCPFSSSTGNEHNAVFLLRDPSLPPGECHAWVLAARSACRWLGWGVGSHSCTHRRPGTRFATCLWGNCWSRIVHTGTVQALPSLSLHPGQASGVWFSEVQRY